MRKVVLATAGTLGDLHPFIAIALALARRGIAPILAVPADQLAKCHNAGVEAVAILPGFEEIRERMGVAHQDAVRRIVADQRVMLEQVLLPGLAESTRALDVLAEEAEAIVSSIFVFAAPIVAEKRGLPLISVILQPMAMLSAYDPPHTPDFWMMRSRPTSAPGRAWNRLSYGAIRTLLDLLYGRRVDRVRAEHGLAAAGARRLLEPGPQSILRIGCYSPHFAALPPDAPQTARVTGFPVFDSDSGKDEALDPVLAAFLSAGPAPLVFTLGTFAVDNAGDFYHTAAATARRLGMRAVLLVGGQGPPTLEVDILRCGYAPHSLLFGKAAIIVHHGGIGTTGQALRAGKPQLVVPHMGDQNDHAYRIERLKVGLRLGAAQFTAERATRRIGALVGDPLYRERASTIAVAMADEHGAEVAADAIVLALDQRQI